MSPDRSRPQLKWSRNLKGLLKEALHEDLGLGDLTTEAIDGRNCRVRGELIAREPGTLAGYCVAQKIWQFADKNIEIQWHVYDGDAVKREQVIASLTGSARGLLAGERVALNFLQRLSGIAGLTAGFVRAVGGAEGPLICDTRKTTPLWRTLERHAVAVGGGGNHRFGLFDMILIKENHARLACGLGNAIRQVRTKHPRRRIMAEAHDQGDVRVCCEERVNLILLDNFTPAAARKVIGKYRAMGIPFEISGRVNLRNVESYGKTGADRISIGALTHSAPSLDMSFQLYLD
jgi:nicotinate-nucleotide pyrophosphorylase (carboxylating)